MFGGKACLCDGIVSLCCSGEDHLRMVADDLLDQSWKHKNNQHKSLKHSQFATILSLTLITEFNECSSRERSAHLQTLRHDRRRDELVSWNLLVEFLVGGLIEENLIVQLVTDLSLRPLLLLGLATATSSLLLLLCLLRLLGRRLGILLWRLK